MSVDQLREEVPFTALFNHRAGLADGPAAFQAQTAGDAYRATIHPQW